MAQTNRAKIYNGIISEIFKRHYTLGITEFEFGRSELEELGVLSR